MEGGDGGWSATNGEVRTALKYNLNSEKTFIKIFLSTSRKEDIGMDRAIGKK